jgi:predicted kinase
MQQLILIRGIPGSGKSTLAKQYSACHLEADMFFLQNGQYCYNAELINNAHLWCQRQTALHLRQGESVVVSNTFIKWWQIKPYIELAKQYGVQVKLIEAKGRYQNIHNVPAPVVAQMRTDYQNLDEIRAKIVEIIPASQLVLR